MAKANGTESEAKPANMTGGWMTIHGSCRSGFSPDPSGGTSARKRKGDCLTRMATMPRNDRT